MNERRDVDPAELATHVRALRVGHGANCSSVGSVIDTLFASAVIGGALFTAVAAALAREEVRIVGRSGERDENEPARAREPEDRR